MWLGLARTGTRIWEIDFLRGLAIIFMVVFHFIADLKDFCAFDVEYLTGFWFYVGKLSAILFIFTAGISATLSKSTLKHGIKIFFWAMLITIVTYIYNPITYIRFGILHFLGISIASYRLTRRLRPGWLMITGILGIIIGNVVAFLPTNLPYLFPFGLTTSSFTTMDYYPLVPWYGIFLFGIAAGKIFYNKRKCLFSERFFLMPLVRLGRHSLAIYLVHQPLLLAILALTITKK